MMSEETLNALRAEMKLSQETMKALRAELKLAAERARIASEHFDEVMREAPSGLPHPDGAQRITMLLGNTQQLVPI